MGGKPGGHVVQVEFRVSEAAAQGCRDLWWISDVSHSVFTIFLVYTPRGMIGKRKQEALDILNIVDKTVFYISHSRLVAKKQHSVALSVIIFLKNGFLGSLVLPLLSRE